MYTYYSQTDTGRVRPNNEDSLAYDARGGVAVLADGMGGHNAGEVASRMAVTYLCRSLSKWSRQNHHVVHGREAILKKLDEDIQQANHRIHDHAASHISCAGMGTTLVAGVLGDTHAVIAHVGDSRCYRFRHGMLSPLTRDHSIWQGQQDLPDEVRRWRPEYAGVITRALGVEPIVLVDYIAVPVLVGDLFLFCSDGLTDMVSDRELQILMAQAWSIEALGRQLVDSARENGGKDNISVLLARKESQD